MDIFEVRNVADRRHQVVLERRGERIAARVVGHVLEQHLADALGEPAGDLAFDHAGIDHRSAVLARNPAQDLDEAGLGIDFDHAQMRGAGEGEVLLRLEAVLRLQTRASPIGQPGRFAIGDLGDFAQRPVGCAGDADHAAFNDDALGAGVVEVRGDDLDLVGQHFRRRPRRAAGDHRLTASRRARSEAADGAVAFENRHVLIGHADPVGDDLGHGRRGAVALRMGAERGGDLAGRLDPDRREVAGHRRHLPGGGGGFDIGGDPQSEIAACLTRFGLFLAERRNVEMGDQLFETFSGADIVRLRCRRSS